MKINKILQNTKQLSTVTTGFNKLNQLSTEQLTTEAGLTVTSQEVDTLLEELNDLTNPQFKQWYAKRFYQLGIQRVLELASQARNDGINKPKLFSLLLKKG